MNSTTQELENSSINSIPDHVAGIDSDRFSFSICAFSATSHLLEFLSSCPLEFLAIKTNYCKLFSPKSSGPASGGVWGDVSACWGVGVARLKQVSRARIGRIALPRVWRATPMADTPTRQHVSPNVCNRLGDVSQILSLTNPVRRTNFQANDCQNKADCS
jgi:hypothetical protein